MSFILSAGAGFIALFGVAILNGIVLVSTTRRLSQWGSDAKVQKLWLPMVIGGLIGIAYCN